MDVAKGRRFDSTKELTMIDIKIEKKDGGWAVSAVGAATRTFGDHREAMIRALFLKHFCELIGRTAHIVEDDDTQKAKRKTAC